jgi:hypothetical protein
VELVEMKRSKQMVYAVEQETQMFKDAEPGDKEVNV